MVRFFLQIELDEEEKSMMTGYFETVSGEQNRGLTKDDFEKILTTDLKKKKTLASGDKPAAEKTGRKIKELMKKKGQKLMTLIENYQS